MSDYLDTYSDFLDVEAISKSRALGMEQVNKPGIEEFRQSVANLPEYHFEENDFSKDHVCIGNEGSLSADERAKLKDQLLELSPWRKGPFNIAGIDIDAEWRSELKWNRVLTALKKLEGRRVCDIGANSGYYMYRMLDQNPEMVLGLDPTVRYYLQYLALQKLTKPNQLHYEPFGLEELIHYPKFFDTIFCMGILYHHRDPISILRMINESMTKGGQLIVESQGIPGDGPFALFPEKTYAKVKGTYFVPTATCLVNWLKKSYFEDIEVFYVSEMSSEEQRPTEWMTRQSYADFVDEGSGLTVEGYPAPVRIFVSAHKRGKWQRRK
ncbi:MAG: tRNA 5-methoxyuridine(34)/uridine 5-oxyacetic acid(34) synthase CmoB [Lentisphaerales bacterium]|nr:tRNA 5-methoxyuridine(34)/uridine 5-oxyacetic acid(34) synthase CmoB [Lentisphaerales bacterium]